MTTHFEQQQATERNLNFSKSAPTPQHGQKADKEVLKRPEPRAFAPQPGPH
jgi:hypothetical protein